MIRRAFSLRTLVVLLVLAAVTPALILILYTASEQRGAAEDHVQAEALRFARIAAAQQQRFIEGARQLLVALAKLPEVRLAQGEACTSAFADLLGAYPFYSNLCVIDTKGMIFCSALPFNRPLSVAHRAYFQRALATREFAVGDYQIGSITKKATINFAYPVLDADGAVHAVVFAAIDLEWLNHLAAEANMPTGSSLTVIDRLGAVLVRYPESEGWVGRRVADEGFLQTVLAQGEGVTTAREPGGVEQLVAFTPLSQVPQAGYAYVSIGIPRETAFAHADKTLSRNLAGMRRVSAAPRQRHCRGHAPVERRRPRRPHRVAVRRQRTGAARQGLRRDGDVVAAADRRRGAPGHPRSAHPTAQSRAVARSSGASRQARATRADHGRAADAGHQPVQGDQRHAEPPERGPPAATSRPAPAPRAAGVGPDRAPGRRRVRGPPPGHGRRASRGGGPKSSRRVSRAFPARRGHGLGRRRHRHRGLSAPREQRGPDHAAGGRGHVRGQGSRERVLRVQRRARPL